MTKLGNIMLTLVAALVLVGGFLWLRSGAQEEQVTTLKIGFIGPLSGNAQEVGIPIKEAVELAVEELKATGKAVELFVEDDGCDPKQASIALQKLVEVERVRFVIGGVCNEEALALAASAEQEKAVLMVPSVATTAVSLAGDFVFRNTQPDAQGGTLLGEYAATKAKVLSAVSDNSDEAMAYHNAFVEAYVGKGGVVTDAETRNPKFDDVKRQVARMKNVKPAPQAVFMNIRDEKWVKKYLDEMKVQGLRVPVFGYVTISSVAADAAYRAQLQNAVMAEAPRLDAKHPKYEALSKSGVDAYNASGYEAVMLYEQGFAGGAKTSEAMRDFLYGVKAYEGVQGTYGFDKRGDMVGVPFVLKVAKNGKWEVVK